MRIVTLLLATALLACTFAARAVPLPVDLTLVLLSDVSKSIDEREYAMMKEGYRAALSDPEVIEKLLGQDGRVAISYVEFSGRQDFAVVQDWTVIESPEGVQAFGAAIASTTRTSRGSTALAANVARAADLIDKAPFEAPRKVIDLASDDRATQGHPVGPVRDRIVERGITINALAIVDDRPIGTYDGRTPYTRPQSPGGMVAHYQRTVIGGYGSFVLEARDFRIFAKAMKQKLLLELTASRDRFPGGARMVMADAAR